MGFLSDLLTEAVLLLNFLAHDDLVEHLNLLLLPLHHFVELLLELVLRGRAVRLPLLRNVVEDNLELVVGQILHLRLRKQVSLDHARVRSNIKE